MKLRGKLLTWITAALIVAIAAVSIVVIVTTMRNSARDIAEYRDESLATARNNLTNYLDIAFETVGTLSQRFLIRGQGLFGELVGRKSRAEREGIGRGQGHGCAELVAGVPEQRSGDNGNSCINSKSRNQHPRQTGFKKQSFLACGNRDDVPRICSRCYSDAHNALS